MQKNELEQKLLQEEVSKDLYSLKGGLPNESYCFNEQNGVWEVYYSERGTKSNLKAFNSETEACEYSYTSLIEMLKGHFRLGRLFYFISLIAHRFYVQLSRFYFTQTLLY